MTDEKQQQQPRQYLKRIVFNRSQISHSLSHRMRLFVVMMILIEIRFFLVMRAYDTRPRQPLKFECAPTKLFGWLNGMVFKHSRQLRFT